MPLQEVPSDPRLDALNERCRVRVENLIELGRRGESIFFTARTWEGYGYFAEGVARHLVNPHNDNFWSPGDEGTPRFRISSSAEFFVHVTHIDGWTLKSAYPKLTLAEYREFHNRLNINQDDKADPSEVGPFDV